MLYKKVNYILNVNYYLKNKYIFKNDYSIYIYRTISFIKVVYNV